MSDEKPAPRRYVLRRTAPAKSYRIDYDRELNAEQQAVVFAPDGPTVVVAGAGSGKTRTLVYRVSRLVEDGVDPEALLLLTFTNRAASEMTRRVEGLLGADLARMTAGTFHSVGARLLRPHAELLGYRPNFSILDSEDSKDLLESATSDLGIPVTERRFPKGDLLRAIVSFAATRGRRLDDVVGRDYPHLLSQLEAVRAVIRRYLERKVAANAMDYDDLLLNWRRLLETHPEVRKALATRFRHVLVDEFQDVNHLQAEIVDLLATDSPSEERHGRRRRRAVDLLLPRRRLRGAPRLPRPLPGSGRSTGSRRTTARRRRSSARRRLDRAQRAALREDAPPDPRRRGSRSPSSARGTSRSRPSSWRSGSSSCATRGRRSPRSASSTGPTSRRWSCRSS